MVALIDTTRWGLYEHDGHSSGLSDALFLLYWVMLPIEGV